MSVYLLGQVVGSLAVALSLAVYQINHRAKMLLLSAAAALLYSAAFLCLHAYTGCALNALAAVRCYAFSRTTTRKGSLQTFLAFALISGIATGVTWNGLVSTLALGGSLCYALAAGQLRTRNMRRVALIAPPLWFAYNLLIHFYPGMFIETFVIMSNVVGQYRFDVRRPNKATKYLKMKSPTA